MRITFLSKVAPGEGISLWLTFLILDPFEFSRVGTIFVNQMASPLVFMFPRVPKVKEGVSAMGCLALCIQYVSETLCVKSHFLTIPQKAHYDHFSWVSPFEEEEFFGKRIITLVHLVISLVLVFQIL